MAGLSILSPAAKKAGWFYHPVPSRPEGYLPDRNLVAQMVGCGLLTTLNGQIVLTAKGLELLTGEKQGGIQTYRFRTSNTYRAMYDMAERHKEKL